MDLLPQARRPLAPILSQMPAYRAVSAPTPVTANRLVANLMQIKDTANILLLLSNGALLVGIFMGFGVPGLVLYGLRWRQARGRAGRGAILVQAVLSLLHELFWAYTFYKERTSSEPFENHEILTVLYGLGAFLSTVQLLTALSSATNKEGPASPAKERLAE